MNACKVGRSSKFWCSYTNSLKFVWEHQNFELLPTLQAFNLIIY